jgi:predicted ATPase
MEDSSCQSFVVISGCSGGGKSTLLSELQRRGHAVVEEPAEADTSGAYQLDQAECGHK